MIRNYFNFSLLINAPESALIACRPEEGGEAILVLRQPDGGVDDPRLNGYEDFFPMSMALAEKTTPEGVWLDRGDWTVIPYIKQQSPNYDGGYRDYLLLYSLKEEFERAREEEYAEEKELREAVSSGRVVFYLKELREEEDDS